MDNNEYKLNHDVTETVRNNLVAYRKLRKLSQTELSGTCGLGQGTLSKLERGHGSPNMTTLITLADALGVEAYRLLVKHDV